MRGAQPWKVHRSAVLRAQATQAEARLWTKLRNRQLGGFKFVRQVAVDCFFVDFLCRERKLVVEVDGATHGSDEEVAADAARTAKLEMLGYRVIRVTNGEVETNIAGVLDTLIAVLRGGEES